MKTPVKIGIAAAALVVVILIVFLVTSTNDQKTESIGESEGFTKNENSLSPSLSGQGTSSSGDGPSGPGSGGYTGGSGIEPFKQDPSQLLNDPEDLLTEAAVLSSPEHTEQEYVNALMDLMREYWIIVKEGGFPTGTNLEITNKLLGDNKRKFALLPASHPKINSSGELVDSWGTPYFFHNEALDKIEIRSAGPDLIMGNDDDVLSGETGL